LFALTLPYRHSKENEHSFYLPKSPAAKMPKLKPQTQRQRREHILGAALRCFGRSGFHATTMQDICKEAGVSPGALYVYFDSKEALIEGICERDRAELTDSLRVLAEAPNFVEALNAIGRHYFVDEPVERQQVVVEMGIESTRNPRIAELFHRTDRFCIDSFEQLFQRLKDEGRINPDVDARTLANVFTVIGDGLFWRRAISPDFNVEAVLPVVSQLFGTLLKPTETSDAKTNINPIHLVRA
jgi:TetR/AcrR family transcriptional regulator, repressor for uid operon